MMFLLLLVCHGRNCFFGRRDDVNFRASPMPDPIRLILGHAPAVGFHFQQYVPPTISYEQIRASLADGVQVLNRRADFSECENDSDLRRINAAARV
jgi:hypothetical protein